MLAHRMLLRRAVLLARLRQSKVLAQRSQNLRLFTQNSQLLIISRGVPRPQLPFLHPPTAGRLSAPLGQSQNQLTRFMSYETTRYYRDVLRQSVKWTAFLLTSLVLFAIAKFGFQSEVADREFPAPPEWSWGRRHMFSKAAADQIPSDDGRIVDWVAIGCLYLSLLQGLEDPKQLGQNLRPLLDDDGSNWMDGVGKAGLDLSEKSEPWRRGYHTCLMGAAKAAEQTDGYIYDTTTKLAYPAEYVVGPSNPNPKRLPEAGEKPPLEENCRPLFPGPEALYIKILTSQGFTSRQRLEAAVAYADWLDFKGLSSTAEEMYDWALDIAMGALPIDVNDIVDVKTGIINSKATFVSTNILTATTALANHHARTGNLAAALPIFLSILRARRQLLLPPPTPKPVREEKSVSSYLFTFAKSWLIAPSYPPPPPTGDEIPTRLSAAICEEAAVMANIGEILFASSSFKQPSGSASDSVLGAQIPTTSATSQLENFQAGLSWTRDAVDLAEETLASTGVSEDDQEARTKCIQCLEAGMENWSMMVERMLKDERAAKDTSERKSKNSTSFWGIQNAGNDNQNRWEGEARVVDTRLRRIKKLLVLEQDREVPLWMRILGKTRDL